VIRWATWVPNTAGDDNGAIPPEPIYQGSVRMGFCNMAEGDAPIFRNLALHYAISDNYHQAVQGGTGANHIPAQKSDFVTVGQSLSEHNISWGYFGEGYDASPLGVRGRSTATSATRWSTPRSS
jgi:phospholipase C